MVETSFIATIACFRGYLLITDYPSRYRSKVLQKFLSNECVYPEKVFLEKWICQKMHVLFKRLKANFPHPRCHPRGTKQKSILSNFYQPPKKLCSWKSLYAIYDFFHPAVLIRHHTPHRIVAGRNHLSFAMMGFLQLLSQFFLLFIISGLSENSIYIFNSFGNHHRKLDSIWGLGFKPGN